jgi:hypothetical protein
MFKRILKDVELSEFLNYKNDLQHLKKVVSDLLSRCDADGLEQNFSCNSEITEIAERIKFSSYKLYTIQNYIIETKNGE